MKILLHMACLAITISAVNAMTINDVQTDNSRNITLFEQCLNNISPDLNITIDYNDDYDSITCEPVLTGEVDVAQFLEEVQKCAAEFNITSGLSVTSASCMDVQAYTIYEALLDVVLINRQSDRNWRTGGGNSTSTYGNELLIPREANPYELSGFSNPKCKGNLLWEQQFGDML